MKKIVFVLVSFLAGFSVKAQDTLSADQQKKFGDDNLQLRQEMHKKDKQSTVFNLGNAPSDHIMVQLGYNGLGGSDDTTSNSGFSRQFNIQFLFNKPLQTTPHLAIGYGVGLSWDNFFFHNKYVNIRPGSGNTSVSFDEGTSNRYKKFKLALAYFEIPLELRYYKNIENPQQGFKFAVGLKPGYLLSAHTKGKNQIDGNGNSVYGSGYINKISDKYFFNSYSLTGTARVGIGAFSLYGNYSLFSMFKSNYGPSLRPFSIGLSVSGL